MYSAVSLIHDGTSACSVGKQHIFIKYLLSLSCKNGQCNLQKDHFQEEAKNVSCQISNGLIFNIGNFVA